MSLSNYILWHIVATRLCENFDICFERDNSIILFVVRERSLFSSVQNDAVSAQLHLRNDPIRCLTHRYKSLPTSSSFSDAVFSAIIQEANNGEAHGI